MSYTQTTLINGDGGPVFPLLRHVHIKGTQFEIGQQLARMNIENHGDVRDNHRTSDSLYATARRDYIRQHYPLLWQRARGAADVFGVDADDERYDFTVLWHNVDLPPQPGCSNAFYPAHRTTNGHVYLSRNYEFSTSTFPELIGMPLPPEARAQMRAMMGEPYIMTWEPTDGGYASWAIHANDLLGGAFDGINSAGLAVALMADEDAMSTMHEPHMGADIRAVGIGELQVVRLLLDTCATAEEARRLLLDIKQYYQFVPCHYIIADASGQSFIYENSLGRNHAIIIDGGGEAQVCTNHQVYRHQPGDRPELTLETNSQWRYATLEQRIHAQSTFSREAIRANSASVGVKQLQQALLRKPEFRSIAANVNSRTLWYTLYDLTEGRIEVDFYLNSGLDENGDYAKAGARFSPSICRRLSPSVFRRERKSSS